MIHIRLLCFLSVFLLLLSSCNQNKEKDKILAEVDGDKLYLSDIYIPTTLHGEDSIIFLKNMVNHWIIEQLLYAEAKEKLSEEELDIEREIERMKKQLIIARYEKKLLSDSVQMPINDEEAMKYYSDNPEEFMLKENIVRVQYVKLMSNSPSLNEIRDLLRSSDVNDKAKLRELVEKNALNAFLDDMVWLYFNEILKEIPIKTYNQEEFLKNNRFVELSRDSIVYLLNIKGFMIKDSRAPYPIVKDKIISILSARKNKELLNEHRNKIYKSALSEKKIQIFL